MEEIKPKKERKFLKAMGDIALTLVRELLLNVGKKVINKSGNKRQGLVLAFIILASTFAIAQYPTTGNKQRLGFQSTGDGLVYRGRASDTVALKPSTINNAYHLFDTINNVLFSYIKTKGGWKFNNSDTVIIQGVTMPFDSITFNTLKDGTVGVGEVEYNDSQGSLIQGLKGGNVTNVIGQQLHQQVNNRTGATLNKGDVVYLSGSQGNRITVAKAIATSDPTSANTFGIVAESIANNQSGYIITEGLIAGLNTSSLTQDSAVYLSGTTAGVLTSTKPQAPIHGVYIGVCVKTNAGSGEVFVKIRNGQEIDELHDVQISSPVNNASLYFKSNEGLWRDTTAALLTSDTSSMLTNYLRSGVAANSYLPLTGGILTGRLKTVDSISINNIGSNNALFSIITDKTGFNNRIFLVGNSGSGVNDGFMRLYENGITKVNIAANNSRADNTYFNGGGNVGIGTISPLFTLDVAGTFRTTGASLIGGTLGVTGATTLSNLASASTTIVTASTTGLLSGISTLPIANGGTGATTAATARTALGATVRGANTFLLPDLGAISFLRYNADNTVSQRGADGMRSDLGGTTIGQSMFTLTNPSAITFPRFNADNTVSALDASTFRTAIGAGTGNGNGTVTNVTGTAPISVANGTTTPNITIAAAGSGTSGVVNAANQQFSGYKTFLNDIEVTGFTTAGGGLILNTFASTSSLNSILGINVSNGVGKISLGSGLTLSSGVLSASASSNASLFISRTGTSVSFVEDLTSYSIIYLKLNNNSTITVTLPTASLNTNKSITIKNVGTGAVNSNSTNVEPLNSTTLGTAILISGGGKYATLVSDGTNWIKMSGN